MANYNIIILPSQCFLINTGIALAASPGTYIRMTSQSRLAVKYGMNIGTGVIDEDY
jgi:dUTP pyrophosphatase